MYRNVPYHTIPYITYIALHYITLHYIALHCITLHYIALHCITLHYIALHCITLHYIYYIHVYIYTYCRHSSVLTTWRETISFHGGRNRHRLVVWTNVLGLDKAIACHDRRTHCFGILWRSKHGQKMDSVPILVDGLHFHSFLYIIGGIP